MRRATVRDAQIIVWTTTVSERALTFHDPLVGRRDRFRCVLCGASPATDRGSTLHVDHMVAVARGGTTVKEKLRSLRRLRRALVPQGKRVSGDSPVGAIGEADAEFRGEPGKRRSRASDED